MFLYDYFAMGIFDVTADAFLLVDANMNAVITFRYVYGKCYESLNLSKLEPRENHLLRESAT